MFHFTRTATGYGVTTSRGYVGHVERSLGRGWVAETPDGHRFDANYDTRHQAADALNVTAARRAELEHLDDAEREAAVIHAAELEAATGISVDGVPLAAVERPEGVAKADADRVVAHYVKVAVDNRGDDLEDFLAELADDPSGILYEVLDTAADMGLGYGVQGDDRYEALVAAANGLIRDARARFTAEAASRLVGRRAVGTLNGVRVVGTIYADDHLGRAMVTTDSRAVTLEGDVELTEDAATNAYGEVPEAVTPRERTAAERVYGLFYR